MKLLFGSFILFSVCAHAGQYPEYPTINFPPEVAVNNVCVKADRLSTIRPEKICLQTAVVARYACLVGTQTCRDLKDGELPHANEELREHSTCVKDEDRMLETPKEYQTTECGKWSTPLNPDKEDPVCLSWVKITKKHRLTYVIVIFSDDGDQGHHQVGSFTLTLPACPTF